MSRSATMPIQAPPSSWPRLREDLQLHRGPVSPGGAPTWTIHDPSANRFYRIGWLDFEILSRWEMGSQERILHSVNQGTTLRLSPAHVERFSRFAEANNLFQSQHSRDTDRMLRMQQGARKGVLRGFTRGFLFWRIPLVNPDRFIAWTLPMMRWVFNPWFWWLICAAGMLGLFLVSRQWDHFLRGFQHVFSVEGALTVGITLFAVKVLHELGHGYAARAHGCRVLAMGVGLIILWPYLWTDTTEAWKLQDRRKRMIIDGAGILMELAVAAVATLLWGLLPEGVLRSALHLVAGTTWIVTLGVNLSPFMRFDGYFLLADWLDIANLQTRAFALARWRLREWLFRYGDSPPEVFPRKQHRLLIVYALTTWVYLFFLFLSIALLVYHFFFKALGLVLMAAEVVQFIALPILSEFRVWVRRRREIGWSPRLLLPAGILTVLILLLVIPWQRHITAPAVLTFNRETQVFSPQAALIQRIHVLDGDRVREGEILFSLVSPDLEYRIERARAKLEILQTEIAGLAYDLKSMEQAPVKLQELQTAAADLEGLKGKREKLSVRSPFPSVVKDVPPFLREKSWVAAKEPLAVLVDGKETLLTAYVSEADIGSLRRGAQARFYPEGEIHPPYAFTVKEVDYSANRFLTRVELVSPYGGALAAQEDEKGQLVPVDSIYRVTLAAAGEIPMPARATPGTVLIRVEAGSVLGRLWRFALGVLIRESGL
jgi:putative peptide zinc metalloprotease protein